jgi:hypothetical protein
MPYKVIIAGSRNYNNFEELTNVMDKFLKDKVEVEIIIGGSKGADTLGERYANMRDLPVRKFLPEWSKYGKAAGRRRNEVMGLEADACVCFWDGGSAGTAHMIQVAKQNSIILHIVEYI